MLVPTTRQGNGRNDKSVRLTGQGNLDK